jgi:hypothetical protein
MRWRAPLDPGCPKVRKFYRQMNDDPMNDYIPGDVLGDITDDFERRHRAACVRCRHYGAENIEVV